MIGDHPGFVLPKSHYVSTGIARAGAIYSHALNGTGTSFLIGGSFHCLSGCAFTEIANAAVHTIAM
ncbi:hypothetical protein M728_003620 (plasmid) [Ensifer sp. WSM1721]